MLIIPLNRVESTLQPARWFLTKEEGLLQPAGWFLPKEESTLQPAARLLPKEEGALQPAARFLPEWIAFFPFFAFSPRLKVGYAKKGQIISRAGHG